MARATKERGIILRGGPEVYNNAEVFDPGGGEVVLGIIHEGRHGEVIYEIERRRGEAFFLRINWEFQPVFY